MKPTSLTPEFKAWINPLTPPGTLRGGLIVFRKGVIYKAFLKECPKISFDFCMVIDEKYIFENLFNFV